MIHKLVSYRETSTAKQTIIVNNLTLCSNQRQVSQCSHQQAPFHSHSGRSSLSTHVSLVSTLDTQPAIEADVVLSKKHDERVLITVVNLHITPVRCYCQSKELQVCKRRHRVTATDTMVEQTTSLASLSHTQLKHFKFNESLSLHESKH